MTIYATTPKGKRATSFRLTAEALRLLAAIAEACGISQSASLELAIRELAKKKGAI